MGAVNNLIARLSEDPELITEQSMKYANEMFQEWREINQFLIQVDTDFIVWACLDFYELIFFVMASKFYVEDPHITLEDVINTLKVFKRITNIISFLIIIWTRRIMIVKLSGSFREVRVWLPYP